MFELDFTHRDLVLMQVDENGGVDHAWIKSSLGDDSYLKAQDSLSVKAFLYLITLI
jgi:hypothetical protein